MKAKKLIAVSAALVMCTSFVPTFTAMPVSATEAVEIPETTGIAEISETQNVSGFRIIPTLITNDGTKAYTMVNVSYLNKGAEKLAKDDNLTLAFRIKDGDKWYGWTPVDAYVGDQRGGMFNLIQDYSSDEMQFCVTKQPYPKIPAYSVDLSQEGMHEELSEPVLLNNPDENKLYKPAPSVIKATPSVQSRFHLGKQKTTRVTAKYGEQLEQTGPVSVTVSTNPEALGYKVSNVSFENASEQVTTGDITWQRDYATVSFDMEFDDVYDAHMADYVMHVNGLVGVNSGKAPKTFGYTTSLYDCMGEVAPFCNDSWGGPNQKVYMSQPVRIADEAIDLNTFDFNRNNYDQFTTNVFLVAERADGTEATFALKYNHVQGVQKLRQYQYRATLATPYPQGFNARLTDVKFRAYKFINNKGEAMKRLELPTRITEKGLEVSQRSF